MVFKQTTTIIKQERIACKMVHIVKLLCSLKLRYGYIKKNHNLAIQYMGIDCVKALRTV